jgi:hypothetical protein
MGGTITGPVTLTWTMPADWAGGTAPTYTVPNGVTFNLTGNTYGVTPGGSVTATIKGKTSSAYDW